jgi:hypothetical protein
MRRFATLLVLAFAEQDLQEEFNLLALCQEV